MITAGSYPPISIDFGRDEPGMILQYRDVERGYVVWLGYTVDGEVVKSPVEFGEDAISQGHSSATIRSAKNELGIVSNKGRFTSGWKWYTKEQWGSNKKTAN